MYSTYRNYVLTLKLNMQKTDGGLATEFVLYILLTRIKGCEPRWSSADSCNHRLKVWDSCRGCIIHNRNHLRDASDIRDPIIITSDSWVVDKVSQIVIGKLPPSVPITKCVVCQRLTAFTTEDRPSKLSVMHFPSTTLTTPGTWDPLDYDEGAASSDSNYSN